MLKFFKKELSPNLWHKKLIKLEDGIYLDNLIIKKYLNIFWESIMTPLNKDQIVLLLFRVKFGDEYNPKFTSHFTTLGRLYKVSSSQKDFNNLYQNLCEILISKDLATNNIILQQIIITYKVLSNIDYNTYKDNFKCNIFRGYNLPNTTNIKTWGTKISINNNILTLKKKGSKFNYEIESLKTNNDSINNVKLILPNLNNEILFTFRDIRNHNDNFNTFTRYIGSNEYYFVNGVLELRLNPWKLGCLEQIKSTR